MCAYNAVNELFAPELRIRMENSGKNGGDILGKVQNQIEEVRNKMIEVVKIKRIKK